MSGSSLRSELHAFVDRIADAIEKSGAAANDYVDQAHSPLGREKHIALVKAGALPGSKEGRRFLVKRADLEAYLAKHKVAAVDPGARTREVERVAATLGQTKR